MKAGRGQRLGRAWPARLGATAASARRRALVAVCSSTAGSTGWGRGRSAGVRGVRTRAGRESAARVQAAGTVSGSGAASTCAGALECLRAQGRGGSVRERERGEGKGVEREKERSTV